MYSQITEKKNQTLKVPGLGTNPRVTISDSQPSLPKGIFPSEEAFNPRHDGRP
jgi:hypothetical protein